MTAARQPDPATTPARIFNARNPAAYENMMGRWSRRLAPLLIRFGGLSDGDRVLDVGCGTGNLSLALPDIANVAAVTGIDPAEVYINHARARTSDPRFTFQTADARSLPFPDRSFDRAFSMLVLQFIPDPDRAVAEMHRVVRPGGTVTACVWDSFGGTPQLRLIWDTLAVLHPSDTRARRLFPSVSGPGELAACWRQAGLLDVEQTSLTIRMDYATFDDYWAPYTTGEGSAAAHIAGLPAALRESLKHHVRRGYLAERPDGPRSFACTAWACRGTVPD